MKKLFYLSVHPLCFLTEIPPLILLWLAFRDNDIVTVPGKLYPLMAASVIWIIFTFIYFFRGVVLSESEIFTVGPFSSRDAVTLKSGKTLVLTKCPRGVKKVEVIGNDGKAALAFLQNREVQDISQLREKIYAGDAAIYRIASLFGVPAATVEQALSSDSYREETAECLFTAEKKNDILEMCITLKKEIKIPEKTNDKYHFRLFDR